jgi:plasmid maintenance system antidote protein VapI
MGGKIFITTIVAIMLAVPSMVSARFYDGNDILTDAELYDGNALSRTAIQQFLDTKNSVLKNTTAVVNGVPKLVSEMIYEIGQAYGISQKFLLAKLQHEQGLIEKTSASQTKLDWATGYSCFSGRCNEKYRGIYKQLDAAADVQRIYTERSKGKGYFGYQVNKETKTSDGYTVKPVNQATTNLYIYTPYHGSLTGIGGNFFFSRVWNQYFTERIYPDGTLLKDSATGEYWKIEKNKRRKFNTDATYLADHAEQDAIAVPLERLIYYELGEPITITNNTVVKTTDSGVMYLLSDGLKHRLVGNSALASLGYTIADAEPITPVVIAKAELEVLEEGEPITEQSIYPKGILLKSDSPGIFYVKHGIKQLLLDEAVWQENFNKEQPVYVSQSVLDGFALGDPLSLDEGGLVKDDEGKFYIISNKKRKRIASADIVKRVYGITVFDAIPEARDELLERTPVGDPIEYIDNAVQDPANYVSYANRTQSQQNITIQKNPYFALFDTLVAPQSMLAGADSTVTLKFRNRGDVEWPAGKIYLKLIDENHPTSSFIDANRIPLTQTATYNRLATFEVPIKAPLEPQKIKEWFLLEYTDASGNILEMPGGLLNQEINVISEVTAEVVEHNIPPAISNKHHPKQIELKLKNTSKDQAWTSRRAAVSLKGGDDSESVFYDARDWIDKEVVGVPINQTAIKPGETGIIKFTLDARRVRAAIYKLVFSMELRDAQEQVYINGAREWELLIRVDN